VRSSVLAVMACVLLASGSAQAIDTEAPIDDPRSEALYQELIHEVRCLVCQNQTIGDSTAPLAADLRREIRRLVVEGKSEGEIKTFLLDRYGDFVLYRPRFIEKTALLWLAPALLLLVGAVTLGRVVQRRKALPGELNADENAASPESKPR
jgi:cytochrome c-type biogenesis protein CcmH